MEILESWMHATMTSLVFAYTVFKVLHAETLHAAHTRENHLSSDDYVTRESCCGSTCTRMFRIWLNFQMLRRSQLIAHQVHAALAKCHKSTTIQKHTRLPWFVLCAHICNYRYPQKESNNTLARMTFLHKLLRRHKICACVFGLSMGLLTLNLDRVVRAMTWRAHACSLKLHIIHIVFG